MKEIGQDLSGFKVGLAQLFLRRTSASLTINDSDVRDDTETFLNKIVPEGRSAPWKHTMEGSYCTHYFLQMLAQMGGDIMMLHMTLIINVYDQKYESGARFWPDVHRHIIIGLIISQLLLIGLLSTKQAAKSTPNQSRQSSLAVVCSQYCCREPEDLIIRCHLCQIRRVHSYFLDPVMLLWTCNHCKDLQMLYHHIH